MSNPRHDSTSETSATTSTQPTATPTPQPPPTVTEMFNDITRRVQREPDEKYARVVYGCLDRDQPIRAACIRALEWPWFDRIVMLLIVISSVYMAFDQPVLRRAAGEAKLHGTATYPVCGPGREWQLIRDYLANEEGFERWWEFTFLFLFASEMCVKLIALGAFWERGSYLRSVWNWLDFIVVVTGFIVWSGAIGSSGGAISVLRLFRILRPLRALQRVRGMRVLVQTILLAMPQICRVFMVLVGVCAVFGIIGVQLFQGKLRHECFYPDGAGGWESTGYRCNPLCTYDEVTQQPRNCSSLGEGTLRLGNSHADYGTIVGLGSWTCQGVDQQCRCAESSADSPTCLYTDNPNFGANGFDNVAQAAFTIFQSITLEGWVDVMYQLEDGDSLMIAWIFQVSVVLVGALIVMNLFLAVLTDRFTLLNEEADESDGADDMSAAAGEAEGGGATHERSAGAGTIADGRPPADDGASAHLGRFRRSCYALATRPGFQRAIFGAILLNTAVMCIDYFPPYPGAYGAATLYKPPGLYYTLFALNALLTLVFCFEAVVKVAGLGLMRYLGDPVNVFDCFVVLVSLLELVLELLSYAGVTSLDFGFSALRAFRVFRVLKLLGSFPTLRKLVKALVHSLSSVGYLSMLLVLVVFIFALLGMEFFGGFTPIDVRYPRWEGKYDRDTFNCTFDNNAITWPDGMEVPRFNFDTFPMAFLSIFIVLSGENWNEIFYFQHRATWDYSSVVAMIYFLALFLVGNLLLFNLFIAILLTSVCADDELDDDKRAEKEAAKQLPTLSYRFGSYGTSTHDSPDDLHELYLKNLHEYKSAASFEAPTDRNTNVRRRSLRKPTSSGVTSSGTHFSSDESPLTRKDTIGIMALSLRHSAQSMRKSAVSMRDTLRKSVTNAVTSKLYDKRRRTLIEQLDELRGTSDDKSLNLFSWASPWRRNAALIALHPVFEKLILVLIVISSITVGLDWPGYSQSVLPVGGQIKLGFFIADCIFTAIFTIEMGLKIVAMGFIRSKDLKRGHPAYLQIGWNWIDFIVVLLSYLNIIAESVPALAGFSGLKSIRAFRAMRPLRLIARMESMRVVVSTLIGAVPAVGGFGAFMTIFLLIFAIISVNLFGGRLGYCLDPMYADETYGSRVIPGVGNDTRFANDYEECMYYRETAPYNLTRHDSLGRPFTDPAFADPSSPLYWGPQGYADFMTFPQWVNPDFGNFDNLGSAMLLLLEVAFLEGWPDVMYTVMNTDFAKHYIEPWWLSDELDPDGLNGNAHTPNQVTGPIFFVLWILLGAFLLVNMVMGVVLDAFNQMKEENDGVSMMSEAQAEWVRSQKTIIATRPLRTLREPRQPWRLPFFRFATSSFFELLMMNVIMLNMVFMMMNVWVPNNEAAATALYTVALVSNIFFSVVYLLEMLLKWVGLGFKQYFNDSWNQFDFVLVLLSIIDIAFSFTTSDLPFPPSLFRMLRITRVIRILRILKTAKNLRNILTTIKVSLPALSNITLLLGIVLYIWSVICMNFFWRVNYTPGDIYPWGGAMTPQPAIPNFTNVYDSNLMLVREGDYWYSNANSNDGDFINRHANFRNLGNSVILLLRCATGESFNGVMHDIMGAHWGSNMLRCCPTCGPVEVDVNGIEIANTSCGPYYGVPSLILMLSYTVIMGFIILNGLFIGVIVDNFTNIGSESKATVTLESIEEFREVWKQFDPRGTNIVPSHTILAILQNLSPPLGLAAADGSMPPRKAQIRILQQLQIPDHDGQVHFMEMLTALSYHVCGKPIVPLCETTKDIQKQSQRVPGVKALDPPVFDVATNYLASRLQSRWRSHKSKFGTDPQVFVEKAPPVSVSGRPVATTPALSLNRVLSTSTSDSAPLQPVPPPPKTVLTPQAHDAVIVPLARDATDSGSTSTDKVRANQIAPG